MSGWYKGDEASLRAFGGKAVTRGVTETDLAVSLLLSRDRMHHSVGWWRNAEYEYAIHLSMSAKAWDRVTVDGQIDADAWNTTPYEQVPRDEATYWTRIVFGEHVDKLWWEPGGTDPRLTNEEARAHATMWHHRLFLHPELLNAAGEPFHPFLPQGEVYALTRWIDGLTPEKVDR